MKYLLTTLFLTIFCTGIVTAQATHIYKGTLGNAAIEMHLRIVKNELFGYYNYTGSGQLLPLNGERKDDKLKIKEYEDVDGFIIFDAIMKNKTLSGTRIDSLEGNQKKFSLTETGIEYVSSSNDSLSGDYRLADMGKGIVKDLTVSYLNNKYIYFEIGISFPGCTGNINGIAPATGNTINFSSAACRSLSLEIYKDHVKVREQHCTPHGKTCDFQGNYYRQ